MHSVLENFTVLTEVPNKNSMTPPRRTTNQLSVSNEHEEESF